jgi:hypothetical protein
MRRRTCVICYARGVERMVHDEKKNMHYVLYELL